MNGDPISLARLPHLTAEELAELASAVTSRLAELSRLGIGTLSIPEMTHRASICRSLLTAIEEARYSLYPRPSSARAP